MPERVNVAALRRLAGRLLELHLAFSEYQLQKNLVAGKMMTAEISEIDVPGLGRVRWDGQQLQIEPEAKLAVVQVAVFDMVGEQ